MWGDKQQLERHRKISAIYANDPVLRNSHHYYDMTREEKMEMSFKKLNRTLELDVEKLSTFNILYYTTINLGAVRF